MSQDRQKSTGKATKRKPCTCHPTRFIPDQLFNTLGKTAPSHSLAWDRDPPDSGLPWGYITRPVLSPSANEDERASVLLHRLGVWELGCEHRGMKLGARSRPDDCYIGLAGCAEPVAVSETPGRFPGRTKMMFRGHCRPNLADLCPTVILT